MKELTTPTGLARLFAGALLVTALGAAPVLAQTKAPEAKTETKAAPKPRTEKSIECSKKADEKKLHGAERKKFREECKKAG